MTAPNGMKIIFKEEDITGFYTNMKEADGRGVILKDYHHIPVSKDSLQAVDGTFELLTK